MGLFKKKKDGSRDARAERLFKDAVKEINELYDDVKSDYADVEKIIAGFSELSEALKEKLDSADAKKLEDFSTRLKKVNLCSKNTVRDIRDVLHNQKKRLAEIKRERE